MIHTIAFCVDILLITILDKMLLQAVITGFTGLSITILFRFAIRNLKVSTLGSINCRPKIVSN